MILLDNETITRIQRRELQEIEIPVGERKWRLGTVHQVKAWIYGKAKAYMRVYGVENGKVRLRIATAFDYLRERDV